MRRLWKWAPALALLATALPALARVGGGQSYSGSSHYSGGGGGGGELAGDVIWLLFRLCFAYPQVGVPVAVVVLAVVVVNGRRRAARGGGWSASGDDWSQDPEAPMGPTGGGRRDLLEMLGGAQGFSLVVFEDFLYALYAATQEARAGGKLATLSAYLSEAAQRSAAVSAPTKVQGVVVGGLHVIDCASEEGRAEVRVRFESNYTEENTAAGRRTYYAVEVWSLSRSLAAPWKAPDKARILACPACGGPLDGVIAGKCSYCGKDVSNGDFDWTVDSIEILEREARQPMLFEDPGPPGEPPPTLSAGGTNERFEALQARDPAFSFDSLQARTQLIFQELQGAWSTRDWKRARPYTSERLFEEWAHWMELYKSAHARNVVDRPTLNRLEIADVESDAYYDSVTLRLWAAAVDYTISDDGKVLGGHRDRERPFSEYWTLIRGARVKGPASAEKKCPQCGAPLSINMAGRCEYCKAEVTSGQFDWVVSRIEQDAAYEG